MEVRLYRRPFATALEASWGKWSVREGSIVRLIDPGSGRSGLGEASPLPETSGHGTHGSDRVAAARAFAVWSATESLENPLKQPVSTRTAGLLSLNDRTGQRLEEMRAKGLRTFKLKVGLRKPAEEWADLQSIVTSLHVDEHLRLDPNRAWKSEDWKFWQPRLNGIASKIQFLEEPFSEEFASREKILSLADRSNIPLALDECLCPLSIEKWLQKGWPGYWIIKPSLMGEPNKWMEALSGMTKKVILSSSFETGIGLSAIIRLAQNFPETDHGLGTQAWFEDTDQLGTREKDGFIWTLTSEEETDLWRRLSTV